MRLAVALLLLAPELLPAAGPGSFVARSAGLSAVIYGSTTSSPLKCAMETVVAQSRCRHCTHAVFARIAEKTMEETELSLPCPALLRPEVRSTLTLAFALPPPCRPPASQPAFIKVSNFRS